MIVTGMSVLGAVGEIKSIGIVVDSDASSRFLAESNCCKRFCRPVPNHSAKEPLCGFYVCKVRALFLICKIFSDFFMIIIKTCLKINFL